MQKKLWNKDFILMLQGGTVSGLGDLLYSVAIGFWVYEMTGSNTLMGVMSSISMFMSMIVMPFSGTIIDKCNRKAVIVGMDVLRGIIMLVVGALALVGKLSVGVVLLAAFLASGCSVFFSPAVSTLMIDIIPHNDMVRGQSIFSGVQTFVNLVGKALSGALVAFCGVPLIITLNGVSYLISAVTEMFITVPKTKHQGEAVTLRGVFSDFGNGLKAIGKNPFLRMGIPCCLLINLLSGGVLSLMLPFVMEKGFTVDMYGYLMAVQTAASFVCVSLLGIIRLTPKQRFFSLSAGFLMDIVFCVLYFSAKNFTLLCVLAFIANFGNTLGNGIFSASLSLALPEDNRGGILGLFSAGGIGGIALSAVIYGIFCDIFPVYLVFIVGTLLSAAPLMLMCVHKATREFIMEH